MRSTLVLFLALSMPLPSDGLRATAPPRRAAARTPARMMARGGESRGGLRLLEWIPSQKALVTTARFTWTTLWKTMLSELAPQSADGAYVRPAPQIGAAARWPAALPMVAGRYHVYVGNACPWCHRVSAALALRGLRGAISSTVRGVSVLK